MARIEGTGIKEPSKEAKRMAMATYRVDPMDKILRDMDKAFKNLSNQESTGAVKETGRGMGDTFDPSKDFRVDASDQIENRPNFFSPDGGLFDSRNDVQVASADGVQPLSLRGSAEYKQELKQYEESIRKDFPGIERYGVDKLQNLTEEGQKRLEDSYNIYRDFNYERNPIKYVPGIDFSKKEEKPSFIAQTKNLAGSIFDAVTGTQRAEASQIPGGMPTGTQFSPSGDTSFASYRMAGGAQQQQGSGIVTPFSQTSMGKGEPRNITKFQDTSMGRKPVANLPSDYKQTEAREFAKAKAFQQAKKNPNVKVGVDSKGQPTATAVQKGRGEAGTSDNTAQGNQARVQQNAKARAQAAAYNRKLSGRSVSQTKAANKAAVRASAAERQKAFKKTGKSTVGARKAAAKKSVQAAAKKRHSAFKKRRAAKRKSRKGKKGKK